jgi:hypothetical protein
LPKVFESLGPGVMEYWSVKKKDINPLAITPTLHYSNTPKLIGIESSHVGSPSFGLWNRIIILTWLVRFSLLQQSSPKRADTHPKRED